MGCLECCALPKALPIDVIAWTTLHMHFSPRPTVNRTQFCAYYNKFLMGNMCVSIDKQQEEFLADLIHGLLFLLLKNIFYFLKNPLLHIINYYI